MKFFLLSLLAVVADCAFGHELRPAFLQLRETGPETYEVLWKVPARGDSERLGLYVQLPEDCTNLTQPMGLFSGGAYIEHWSVRSPNGLTGKSIRILGFSMTFTDVLVRLERSNGATQVLQLTASTPSFLVDGTPGQLQMVSTYLKLGIEHILLGVDHLLFVLGLLLIVRGRMMLLKTITSFTLAHSITLAAATLGYASAPLPPLNAAIALSILFLGPEIVRAWRGQTSLTIRYPWIVAFAFGLLHGFGFASGLSTTGIPQAELPIALLSFNGGVESGQVAFVTLALLLVKSFHVLEIRWPIWVQRAPGYVVGACGAFWTIERTASLLAILR
jgi:hydrogenase/urease accessory protein HupE